MKADVMSIKSPIKSVVIAGGGTAGWMAAAALSRMLDSSKVKITLVESEAIGTVGVGEATIPNIATFNKMLGIDERDFMANTHATVKYGIEFVGWTKDGESYFHPFGTHGRDMMGMSFHQFWRKLHALGKASRIETYSATAMAAKQGKACLPSRDPNSLMSTLKHAYQFDAGRYAAFLRKYSENNGVTRVEGKITDVDVNSENGFIETLLLDNGKTLRGEFFIDCTGFRALLTEKVMETPFRNWSHWLPCNSALAVGSEKLPDSPPFTKATAREAGWQWQIPLQHRTGNGHVYCSDFMSDQLAGEILLKTLASAPLSSPKQLRFTTGQREKMWTKNCLALGLSGGFLEPLESTSIYLIQAGISRLLALFPDTGFNATEIDEYNKLMDREFAQVRDFLILHYVANERRGEPFWDYVRNMSIPDSLKRKIDLFKGRGRYFRYDGDLFTETSWIAVFLGQNVVPEGYNPLVDSLPENEVENRLSAMRAELAQAVPQMPEHDVFLSRYCPAPKSE